MRWYDPCQSACFKRSVVRQPFRPNLMQEKSWPNHLRRVVMSALCGVATGKSAFCIIGFGIILHHFASFCIVGINVLTQRPPHEMETQSLPGEQNGQVMPMRFSAPFKTHVLIRAISKIWKPKLTTKQTRVVVINSSEKRLTK